MTKYYFLAIVLPPLSLDTPPDISFTELSQLLEDNLTQRDYEKTMIVRRFFDISNLRALWVGEPLDTRGTMAASDLEEAWMNRAGLPEYVYDFLEMYTKKEDRLRHFPLLWRQFFKSAAQIKDPFLQHYLHFEREIRLLTAVYRAKKLQWDSNVELQYEDPEEEFIAQLIAQKENPSQEFPEKYKELQLLLQTYEKDPLSLQKALDIYRLETIEQLVFTTDSFSIERILAYLVKLIIIEKWFTIDKVKGSQIIDLTLKEYHGTNSSRIPQ
jgi:hypothetical protein